MVEALIRIVAPKWAERRRVSKLAKQARPQAYEATRELFALASLEAIAAEYGADDARDLSSLNQFDRAHARRQVVEAYAFTAHPKETLRAAMDGAWKGIQEFEDAESDRELALQAERRASRGETD